MNPHTHLRRSHTRLWIEAAIGVVVLAALIVLFWYVRSPRFADFVRRKTIATLEEITGGRVELHAFRWNLSRLEVEADDLTIHGLEGPDQQPYAHADRIHVRLHIVSFVAKRISLKNLTLDHPVVHLIVYPDGTTNAAEPKQRSNATPVQQLFDLEIARLEVNHGLLLVNDQVLPLDFAANDLTAAMTYDHGDRRYDGAVQVGKMDVKFHDLRDVAAHGELGFSLWSNRLQIKSLNLTSENSSLQATGKVSNFEDAELDFKYNSELDVEQLGSVIRLYELRGGRLTLNGSGSYSTIAGIALQGNAAASGVTYLDNGVAVRDARATADFSLAHDKLALTRIAGRLLGGGVTGDAEIRNVFSGPTRAVPTTVEQARAKAGTRQSSSARKPILPPVAIAGLQQGSARLRVTGLSLTELARMFSTGQAPYEKLNPVGSVGGTVNLAWTGSVSEAGADLALDVTPPAQPSTGQLPVTATVKARYNPRAQVMDFSVLTMTTPHSHVNATGTLGSTSAALHLILDTTSLTEFQPLLAAMGSSTPPIELAGEAGFNGTLSGRLRDPQIAGHVQASDFTYVYTPTVKGPATTPPPAKKKSFFHFAAVPQAPPPPQQPMAQPRRVHIDQFSGDVQYSSTNAAVHHGVIEEGGTHLNVDASATLQNGSFTENLPFQVQAAIRNADVAQLQRAAGLNYPVTGTLNFTVQAAGTQTNPRGSGHFSLTSGEAYGRPVKSLTANIVFADHEAQLDDIQMQAMRGKVAGSAAYNFGNQQMHFDLAGEGLDLASIPELQMPHIQVGGVGSFTAKGSGTTEQPHHQRSRASQ